MKAWTTLAHEHGIMQEIKAHEPRNVDPTVVSIKNFEL